MLLALVGRRARHGDRLLGAGRALVAALRRALRADAVDLTPDLRVLGFTLVVSLADRGAVRARAGAQRLAAGRRLRAEAGERRGRRQPAVERSRNLLVVSQVALSLVALIGAGLFVRSLANAQKIDPGFDYQKLPTAERRPGRAGLRRGARTRLPPTRAGARHGAARRGARDARQRGAALPGRASCARCSPRAGQHGPQERQAGRSSTRWSRATSRRWASRSARPRLPRATTGTRRTWW